MVSTNKYCLQGWSSSSCSLIRVLDIVFHLYSQALRRWSNLYPSREFRCFIYNDEIVGVCQRDPNYYEHLHEDGVVDNLKEIIADFFEDELQGKAPLKNCKSC